MRLIVPTPNDFRIFASDRDDLRERQVPRRRAGVNGILRLDNGDVPSQLRFGEFTWRAARDIVDRVLTDVRISGRAGFNKLAHGHSEFFALARASKMRDR
jgi:hypothetical protein